MSMQPNLVTAGDSLRESFGKVLTSAAGDRPQVVVLDCDVAGGTGTHHFRNAYPKRFFQMGIAEQNAIGVASGLACVGLVPVMTSFAIFLMRGWEQIRLSIAYAGRNVKIVASHPGLDVGPDGASAQCLEDLALMRTLPGMVVVSPADQTEMSKAVPAILDHVGPVYMRTGRSPARRVLPPEYCFELGRAKTIRPGDDVTIIACGVQVARALDAADILAAEGVGARVLNCSTIKPLDSKTIIACVKETGALVTTEDHNVIGGLGSAVAEIVTAFDPCPIEYVGVKDRFGESGEPDELAEQYGLTGPAIAAAARRAISRKRNRSRISSSRR